MLQSRSALTSLPTDPVQLPVVVKKVASSYFFEPFIPKGYGRDKNRVP